MRIEKTVDRGSKEKLYVQIYSIFLEKIENGEWPEGTQIPPEGELCRIYDVSKITVREAIQELVREGYLIRQQGKGTFVTHLSPSLGIAMRTRLPEGSIGEEVRIEREVLEKGIKWPSEDIKKILMTEDMIHYILSKNIISDTAYTEEFFIPVLNLPALDDTDLSNGSIYALIEAKGTKKIFKIIQTIEVTRITCDNSAILSMNEGSPALLISRIFISSDGSPIAYSRLIGSERNSMFQMEFEKIK